MIVGKTKTGFKFQIDERALSDWRFVKALADFDSNDESRTLSATPIIVSMIFGKDEERLMEHVKDNDGFISTEAVMAEVRDVFEAVKKSKVKN